MTRAHQETIALFKMEAHAGESPQLRQFAVTTLPVLDKHLQIAEQLSPMRSAERANAGAMAAMPQAAVDSSLRGNPDHAADQLNARELTNSHPS